MISNFDLIDFSIFGVLFLILFVSLRCPFEDCKYNSKIIKAQLSELQEHIYRDHGYIEKRKLALELDIIENIDEQASAKWFSKELAKEGVINEK